MAMISSNPTTQALISLLELGLCARKPGSAIVFFPEGYWKRGNVQMVCQIFHIEMLESI
jgi:hypothetical protein